MSRLLALSMDKGGFQAVFPVLQALASQGATELFIHAPPSCAAMLAEAGLPCSFFDGKAFGSDPEAYAQALFDVARPDLLLSGTSPTRRAAPRTLEQSAVSQAAQRGVKSLAVLDYWGMYKERFSPPGGQTLDLSLVPDTLCVLGRTCRDDLIALGVPAGKIAVTHNPWFDRLARESETPLPAGFVSLGGWTVLFVSQPLFAFPDEVEPQERMLRGIVDSLPEPAPGARHQVLIWKHQAEPPGRWADPRRFATPSVAVRLEEGRGSAFLAHADFLATFHSTVAYDALYYGTPCLSLRFGVQGGKISPQYIEKIGLSFVAETTDSLRSFWASAEPRVLRQRLLACKKQSMAEGVFFSDGGATERVLREVRKLLES